jgi:hypothetical protein
MLRYRRFGCLCVVAVFFSSASYAESQCGKTSDFNSCILEAVDLIHQTREHGGYADQYFTRDLDYGPYSKVIKASKAPLTMCVAAVSETLVTALNIYLQ